MQTLDKIPSSTCYRTLPPGMPADFMLAAHEFGVPHAPGLALKKKEESTFS